MQQVFLLCLSFLVSLSVFGGLLLRVGKWFVYLTAFWHVRVGISQASKIQPCWHYLPFLPTCSSRCPSCLPKWKPQASRAPGQNVGLSLHFLFPSHPDIHPSAVLSTLLHSVPATRASLLFLQHNQAWFCSRAYAPFCPPMKSSSRDLLGAPVVKTPPSNPGDVGLLPGQGAKIPHSLGPKNKKQKQNCNKFKKDFWKMST